MERAFHLTVSSLHARLRVGIVLCVDFLDCAVFCFLATRALHDVSILEAHFLTRHHTEELLWSVFHEVFTLHPKFAAESHCVCAVCFILRIVDCCHFLRLTFRIVRDDKLHRMEHSAHAQSAGIEVFTCCGLKHSIVVERIKLGVADHVDKLANGFRRITTTTKATYSRHSGVIPSIDEFLLNKSQKLTF